MNKKNKIIFASTITLTIALSSSIALFHSSAKANPKNIILTAEEIEAKQDKKLKVNKALSDVESDILTAFKINKNSYIKVDLSDMPSFSRGKFKDFNETAYYKKATLIINNEINSTPIGSFKPVILINKKELIFAYKDKNGENFIKKYEFKNNTFESVLKNSKKAV